ncbi:hypothetical protein JHU04_002928 [Brenneria sp. 4F2]|nr:hypothetical protein [Brenneria bubanii]
MISSMLNWAGWGSKPRWMLAAAQVVLVGGFTLFGIMVTLTAERRQIMQVNHMITEHRVAIRHLQQQLGAMPSIAGLRMQLAEQKTATSAFHADTPSQLVSAPLSQPGTSLLSWQPLIDQRSHNAWLLTFSADYQGLLEVLRKFTALPSVLRIDRLVIKSVERGLHIDMNLVKPAAERRTEIE